MASRTPGLTKVGRYWHYSLVVNGIRAHGSTRATDLKTARKVMEDRRRELLLGRSASQVPQITVRELVELWLKSNRPVFSESHLRSAECAIRKWVLPVIGRLALKQVGNAAILQVRNQQLSAGRSPTYANNTLKTIRALFNFAVKLGNLPDIPFEIPRLRVQKKPRPVVARNRVSDFFAAVDEEATNPHVRVMLRVMVGLGMRESEVLGMRWEWFDPANRTYTVGKAKGKEARVLPVPAWLWDAIHTIPKTCSPWVFPALDGAPHRKQFCKKALRRVCEKLGLGNVTQHRLRATFATLHAEAGTPVTEIQGMLGHKDISTTMIYVEQNLEARRRAQANLEALLGLTDEFSASGTKHPV